MAERLFANVHPELLIWARETSGLSLEKAAKKLGMRPERLAQIEAGQLKPTVRQLREAARVYKRPLAAFFLRSAPPAPPSVHDFRRAAGEQIEEPSPALLLELRRARRRRAVALELLSELEQQALRFDLWTDMSEPPEEVAARARAWLGVTSEQQASWTGEYDGLNGWIAALEARGILVFQTGDVGLSEMRGFSLADQVLPAVVLNGKDRPKARIFTLMHEFTHLMLNMAGVCDPLRSSWRTNSPDARVETYCNRVAGAVLVPRAELTRLDDVRSVGAPIEWNDAQIRSMADRFAVSREVVLLRLRALDLASQDFVSSKFAEYRREYAAKASQPQSGTGFPPVYRLAVRDNGKRFTRLVLEALERDRITLADVTDYLGVRLKHLERIADAVRATNVEEPV
jgi:Zn-dependent peptidase ImmA (M78 family)